MNLKTSSFALLLFAIFWVTGLQQSFAATPQSDGNLLRSARQHKGMFEDAEAIEDYTKYLATHQNDEKARIERAEELRNEKRYNEAIADYKLLIGSKDKLLAGRAATDLGKLYQKLGQYKQAIATYKLARSFGIPTLLTEISDCALATGDTTTALEVANEIVKTDPRAGRQRRAEAYMKLNKPKLALDDLNYLVNQERVALSRVDKDSPFRFTAEQKLSVFLKIRAKCYEQMKEKDLALKDLKEIRTAEQDFYNELPFRINEKH